MYEISLARKQGELSERRTFVYLRRFRTSFAEDASSIFEDAGEEFQSVTYVQGVLENWKAKHNQVTRDF
jgi:hypothetical protein